MVKSSLNTAESPINHAHRALKSPIVRVERYLMVDPQKVYIDCLIPER